MKANLDIRVYALQHDVKMYEIAQKLKVHYATLNNMLRVELTEWKKQKIFQIIDELSSKKEN